MKTMKIAIGILIGIFTNVAALSQTAHTERAAAGENNTNIIQKYSFDYQKNPKQKQKSTLAKGGLCIMGIDPSSVVSSDVLELELIQGNERLRDKEFSPLGAFFLCLRNLSDEFIYVDLANTYMIDADGKTNPFYEDGITILTDGTTTGVGAHIGTGISVGGSHSQVSSASKSQQRIISVAPNSKRMIFRYVEDSGQEGWHKYHTFSECGENFYTSLTKRGLCLGELKRFTYDESPLQQQFIITYSFSPTFEHSFYLDVKVFAKEVLGTNYFMKGNYVICDDYLKVVKNSEDYFIGVNDSTIFGAIRYLK